MDCTSCGHRNPEHAKFCMNCGSALEERCPSCGTPLPPGARFCVECGASIKSPKAEPGEGRPGPSPRDYTPKHLSDQILRSRYAMEGERKHVTVLFADLGHSMEIAERLDPEEWHGILDRFFELLTESVHRYEGTVNQYTGDGVMALFGAPIAHEDHAQRACYAALSILDEVARYARELDRQRGIELTTRLGLNSGEVVVGKIGDDLRMDYTARGHTVGLAQRMESLASPSSCFLTGATAALVSGYFELDPKGSFEVKGVSEPVAVHRLTGVSDAKSRFEVAHARGLNRLVGRDSDMQALEGALEQAQNGNGQVVGLVGEAGTGKSRLSYEFAERCRANGLTVNQSSGMAHGKNVPYLPMLQLFRGYYGIGEDDDASAVRRKVSERMLPLDETFREVLPVLYEFFGAPDPDAPAPRIDPDAKQRQIFSVLRRLVQGDPGVSARTFVTVLEDLHWLDPGSEAFLEHWVEAVSGSSAFLLVNYRPEYRADWMQKSYYRQLPINSLGSEATEALVFDMVGGDESAAGLAASIHQRTGGNPFFTEEVVRTLVESGHLEGGPRAYRLATPVEHLEVPASVEAVLAARIDRLADREKQALQTAAVIGKDFGEAVLVAASALPATELREALAALVRGEFIQERVLFPQAEYSFRHPLTQEVALRTQLLETRRRSHAAVARAIEATTDSKLDEVAALLAHHLEEAGEALSSARWHLRAAEWVGRSNVTQSVRHAHRVLALTEGLDESEERGRLRLAACSVLVNLGGWRIGLSLDEVEPFFEEACELAGRLESPEAVIGLGVGFAATCGMTGHVVRYVEIARDTAALIDEHTSPAMAAVALSPGVGYALLNLGRLEESVEFQDRAIEAAGNDPFAGVEVVGFSAWGSSRQNRAEALGAMGALESAEEDLRRDLELFREHDLVEPLGWGLGAFNRLADWKGERPGSAMAQEALRFGLESVEMAERRGSPFSRCLGCHALAVAHLVGESWAESIEACSEALAVARGSSGLEREAQMLTYLARAHLGAGDPAAAAEVAREAVESGQVRGTRFYEAGAQLALARSLRERDGAEALEAARRALRSSQEAVAETGGRVLAPQILEEEARLAILQGERALAERRLREARALYTEIGASGHAQRLGEELAG